MNDFDTRLVVRCEGFFTKQNLNSLELEYPPGLYSL